MSKTMMACGCAANCKRRVDDYSWVDACGIHGTTKTMPVPDLDDRMSRCSCGNTKPSSMDLPFFEYRGPGSRESLTKCKCGYNVIAHTRTDLHTPFVCKNGGFEAAGPNEFDLHYCGCRGWD